MVEKTNRIVVIIPFILILFIALMNFSFNCRLYSLQKIIRSSLLDTERPLDAVLLNKLIVEERNRFKNNGLLALYMEYSMLLELEDESKTH